MAVTQIHGGKQIQAATITNAEISASAAIALSKLAEAVIQADGGQAFTADQSMGTFKLTNLGSGTAASDAINKGQLDAAIAGLAWKAPAAAATTAVLSGTMIADNGTPATGERAYNTTNKTITWFATEGPTTIDGVTLTNGMRIVVKDESATSGPSAGEGRTYNGIYDRTSADVWTRSSDIDVSAEFEGAAVFVQQGTVNANRGYTQTTDSVTMQTSNIIWVNFTATNGDANTLDGLDSLQFLRSDANDSVTTGVTLNIDSGATLSIDGTWDIAGTAVTSSATELNLLDGLTGTVWTSNNDGAGSGLDADLLDGLSSAAFLRATASSALATGNTLNIDSGATLSIDGTWDIAGTAVTSSATELNLLDGLTGTVWTSNNDGAGSGLDADLLDGLSSAAFLRATASSALATGNTLNIDSGATLSIDGTWDISGTAVTATAAQLNALGNIVNRETPTGTVNGSNDTFVVNGGAAITAGSEHVYVNGLLQEAAGGDYTLTAATGTIVFVTASIPQTGSKIVVSYRD